MSSIHTGSDTPDHHSHWCPLCRVKIRGPRHVLTRKHRSAANAEEMYSKNFVKLNDDRACAWAHWLTNRGLVTRTQLPNVAWIPNWVSWLFDYHFHITQSKKSVEYLLQDPDNLTAFLIWERLTFEENTVQSPARVIDYFVQVGVLTGKEEGAE